MKLAIPLLLLLNLDAFACGEGKGFLPENDLEIPSTVKTSGLSETQYHEVIDKVEKVYAPIAESFGSKLIMERLWDNPRVNAGTIRERGGKIWRINLYGGFARHPSVTPDGFALVICHEIGHHIGGAPKKGPNSAPWSSNEGQADYFATLKCLRKVFEGDNNSEAIGKVKVPEIVSAECEYAPDKDICVRTSMAGLAISHVSADIRKVSLPTFETPDPAEVKETFEKHPLPQCRLDTYFQGAICQVDKEIQVSQKDPLQGTCHEAHGHTRGLRPGCWFDPWSIKKGRD